MGKDIGGGSIASKLQHGRPEEGVEVKNVFANKVVLLHRRIFSNEAFKVTARVGAELFQACVIANRCVKPDIEIFTWGTWNFKTEIGRIARDVPISKTTFFAKPLFQFVAGFGLKPFVVDGPLTKKV